MSQCHSKYEFKIQARRFHIVLNKKSLEHLDDALKYIKNDKVVYILCRKGLNKRKEEHAHIYVCYSAPRRLTNKSTFGAHIAKCRGTSEQNVAYINDHHPELVLEEGEMPKGKDNIGEAWQDFIDQIKSGEVDKYSKLYARYEGYANRRLAELKPKPEYNGRLKSKNLWMWGPQRTGKTYWSQHFLPKPKYQCYRKHLNKWWDGYTGQKIVILSDIDPKSCECLAHYIKDWADRTPFLGAVKGSTVNVVPAEYHLIATSNYSIDDCFNAKDAAAIKERFEEWYIPDKMPNLPEEEE